MLVAPALFALFDVWYLFQSETRKAMSEKGAATPLAAQPNLHGLGRGVYALVGAALILFGFFGVEWDWARYALPVLGGLLLIEGLIGFSILAALMGIGKKEVR